MNDTTRLLAEQLYSLRDRFQGTSIPPQALDTLGLQYKATPGRVLLPALGIFGAGLAVGAALGLLFAPKPGRETRRVLVDTVEHARHRTIRPPEEPEDESNPYLD